jgi:hypothetical protein
MDISSTRTGELVVDASLFEVIWNNYTYIPPPISPYTSIIQSSAFKALSTPIGTLPI